MPQILVINADPDAAETDPEAAALSSIELDVTGTIATAQALWRSFPKTLVR